MKNQQFTYSALNSFDLKKLVKESYQLMKQNNWITSSSYAKKIPKVYHSKKLPSYLMNNISFYKNMLYVSHLFNQDGQINELTRKEFAQYGFNMICVYCSVLFYMLCKKNADEDKLGFDIQRLKYVQGFFKHESAQKIPVELMNVFGGDTQIGNHAFLEVEGCVFDFTITQQRMFFDFKGEKFIAGQIPEGMELYGFAEKEDVIYKYAEQFAKEENMNLNEWIGTHNAYADALFKENISNNQ